MAQIMTETDLGKMLEKKLQKALEYARYKERGLSSNPFNIDFSGNIWQIKVDRDEELVAGIEHIKEMADNNSKVLNILGTHGLGKTIFIQLLYELANRYNVDFGFEKIQIINNSSEFKQNFVDASFIERGEGEIFRVPPPLMAELKRADKPILLFIDDADIIFQDYAKIFSEISHLPKVYIISAWNRSAWERAKHRTDVKFPSVEIIALNKFSNKECEEIIKKRINKFKMGKRADTLFTNEVIEAIATHAHGSPHRTIRLAKRLLSYMIDNDIVNIKIGDQFDNFLLGVEDITYEVLMRKMISLSDTQRKIIDEMKNLVEADAKKIGDILGITRVGALKQLKDLEQKGFIVSHSKNKKHIYQLREEIEYGTEE